MATGLSKKSSLVAVAEETTPGTYEAPLAAEFVPVLEDGFDTTFSKELLDRSNLTGSIGNPTPLTGEKSVEATIPLELKASGVEGEAPDADLLYKGALGNSRAIAARVTTGTSHTTTQINIEDADIADFTVGDGILILESGEHHLCAVTAVDATPGSANITISPAAGSAPSDNVEIAKSTIYYPANSGHPSLSVSIYDANQKIRQAIGMKVTSLAIENFTTGQIANANFSLEGLTFNNVDGTFGSTPVLDSNVPPVVLGQCLFRDGVDLQVNNFSLTVSNSLGFQRSTCNANGKSANAVTEREITGSFDPYMDDSDLTTFNNFNNGTTFSVILTIGIPSATAGELTLGSCIVIYLPSCIATEYSVTDLDLILQEGVSFTAGRGAQGTSDEIFISMI